MAKAAEFTDIQPAFGIGDHDEAMAYYRDWLGFQVDFTWREGPGKPSITWISRGGVTLVLNEGDPSSRGSWLNLRVRDLHGLAAEWNERRPGGVAVTLQPPYEIPTVFLQDPWGNRLNLQQATTAEEEKARRDLADRMRDYVRQRLDAGAARPTPEELVKEVGRPLGLAIEVLGEFPESSGPPDG